MAALTAAAPAPTGGIAGWATDLMATFGAPGAGLIVALENLFPPIPSEIILPLAGFAAGRGEFSLTSAVAWTTGGSVVGAVVLYLVGVLVPEPRIRRVLARMPLVSESDVTRAEAWFDRHGRSAVFFGRMLPGVRSFVSLPAGARRMPWWEFTLFTAAGSLIWNLVFVGGGYALGSRWALVERYAGWFQSGVLVLLVAVVGWALVRRYRKHRRVARMQAPTAVPERPEDDRPTAT